MSPRRADHVQVGVAVFRTCSEGLKMRAGAAILILVASCANASADLRSEGFERLTGAQIRDSFSGRTFSDDVHFSFLYTQSGAFEGAGMGKKASGKWWVEGDQLCQSDSDGENCFEIWRKHNAVLFVLGEDFVFSEGTLE
jgi:hypothetical protein